MFENTLVNGAEFIKMVRRIAKQNGIAVRLVVRRGKGSHGRLYYGDRFTTIKDRKKEIGPELYRKMLHDLGIDE